MDVYVRDGLTRGDPIIDSDVVSVRSKLNVKLPPSRRQQYENLVLLL